MLFFAAPLLNEDGTRYGTKYRPVTAQMAKEIQEEAQHVNAGSRLAQHGPIFVELTEATIYEDDAWQQTLLDSRDITTAEEAVKWYFEN